MSTKLSSTLAGRNPNFAPERQDSIVDKYHRPRVSVVVSHYNYSDFLFDALKSVQQQTYENFSCVVVDDFSKDHHFQSARESVGDLGDARFRIIRNASNSGQVQTFYHGIDEVESAFVSLLDPDDRYAPNFLECMLTAHLSSAIFCPLVCCEQHLTKSDGILTSLQKHWGLSFFEQERAEREVRCFETNGFHRFVYPTENGWHWTTSSSMLFRTDALKLIRPKKKLTYNAHADAYCAQGAHMLGGTILLNKPLVYRGLHKSNEFIGDTVFSIFREQAKVGAELVGPVAKIDALEAFLENGGLAGYSVGTFSDVVKAQFPGAQMHDLIRAVPEIAEILKRT